MAVTRVVMVIDHLEPGGAQRQFCLLATSLHRLGFAVRVVVFRRDDFFADILQEAGPIPVMYLEARTRLHLIYLVRNAIRRDKPDVVISFLSWPNLLVELGGLPRREFSVVVSERNLDVSTGGAKRYLRYFFHRFADIVVSNSYAQRERIEQIAPHLKDRTEVIVNGVDTLHFKPTDRMDPPNGRMRVLVLARFAPQKNALRFVAAVHMFRAQHPDANLIVDWYGKKPVVDVKWAQRVALQSMTYYRGVESVIARYMMQDAFCLHTPHKDVRQLYAQADVVCLPSLYEGFSNVIGEAMACGVPVLASRVSDNVRLVEEGRNGFLFDPMSVEDMANTIRRFAAQSDEERRGMGLEARRMAESMLSTRVFTDRFVKLIGKVSRRRIA